MRDGEVGPAGVVGLADRGDHHRVDQGGDRAAVDDAGGLLELGPVREPHAGVVGAHLLELQADERREVGPVPALREPRPALGQRAVERCEAVGVRAAPSPANLGRRASGTGDTGSRDAAGTIVPCA